MKIFFLSLLTIVTRSRTLYNQNENYEVLSTVKFYSTENLKPDINISDRLTCVCVYACVCVRLYVKDHMIYTIK